MISVISSNLEDGVSGKCVIGPDFFSKSAKAFLNGVGVLGTSPLRKIRLLGVEMTSEADVEAVASVVTIEIPCGVLRGL